MSLERFHRFNVRSTEISCLVIAVMAALMWLATAADHLFGLRWGWDVEIIWIAPIVGGGALLIRTLARAIFRWVGATD
jgi:hypothetical protein